MSTSDFGGSPLLPFAILGLAMTIGYAVWSWQRARKRRAGASAVPLRRNRIEDELRAEIEAARRKAQPDADEANAALDLTEDQRRERDLIRALAERKPE